MSVTGPGGIGKSRLAWELEKYLDGVVETIYWHRGRCPAYGDGVTFWALGEMVRSRARLPEGADEATTRSAIAAMVGEWVTDEGEREWIQNALLALLGIGDESGAGRELLFAAWRRFFESIAARGTTVLVFEDLQWADPGLLDFIDHLLDWSKSVPLMIITLARPELFDRRPDWGAGRRTFTALALDPLPPAAMREMLAALVPDLPEQAQSAIVDRADGIPLYAVETVRMLLADGRLKAVDGVYRPTGELGNLEVPESLRSLIAARLDALPPADRRLLQDASVLGQSFTLDALGALTGTGANELSEQLRGLIRRELLTLDADPRSPERGQYAFVQSLDSRGRLLDAGPAGTPRTTPCRRALSRGPGRRRAGRSPGGPLRGGPCSLDGRPRGRGGCGTGAHCSARRRRSGIIAGRPPAGRSIARAGS